MRKAIPANAATTAVADGTAASRTFPLPQIKVRERQKFSVYLPLLQRNMCKPGRPFDVVLALDMSTSMRGAKLDATRAAAREFLMLLESCGVERRDLKLMVNDNPGRLFKIADP